MTAPVVRLDDVRKAKTKPFEDNRHTEGPMKCERCDHIEPAVVAPMGRKWFECVACGCMAAKRLDPILPADGELRQACPSCKSQTFSVMPDFLMCSDCGTLVEAKWP